MDQKDALANVIEVTSERQGTISTYLIQCLSDFLKKESNGTLDTLCVRMLELYGIDREETQSALSNLVSSGKLYKNEHNGTTTYHLMTSEKETAHSASTADGANISPLILDCVRLINRSNADQGAAINEISDSLLKQNISDNLLRQLQGFLDIEIAQGKLKRNDDGLYFVPRKRGRPSGTGYLSNKKSPKTQVNGYRKSSDEKVKDFTNSKKKRAKRMEGEYEGNNGIDGVNGLSTADALCDFCLKSSSTNKMGLFEELLYCKDCAAKAHPSCMGYSELLSRRARLTAWQCIDCKTCCLCLDSGCPDNLLFCDACDKGYHMFCHDPPVQTKPQSKWACHACLNDGVSLAELMSGIQNGDANDSVFHEGGSKPVYSLYSVKSEMNIDHSASSFSSTITRVSSPTSLSKSALPASPSLWSVTHVVQYIEECGFHEEAKKFQEQEIDGKSMLLLLREDVIRNLCLKLGPALKIYEKIRILQKGTGFFKSPGRS